MPDRLSVRATLLIVALAFGVAFTIEAVLAAGPTAAKPVARQSAPTVWADAPVAESDLSLAAAVTVPALQDPRRLAGRKKVKKKRSVSKGKAVPNVAPSATRAAPLRPSPAATPRHHPPGPQRATPAPKPKSTPKPPQTSGEFDSSGEP